MRVQCPCAGTSREVVSLCSDFSVLSIAGVRSWIGAVVVSGKESAASFHTRGKEGKGQGERSQQE